MTLYQPVIIEILPCSRKGKNVRNSGVDWRWSVCVYVCVYMHSFIYLHKAMLLWSILSWFFTFQNYSSGKVKLKYIPVLKIPPMSESLKIIFFLWIGFLYMNWLLLNSLTHFYSGFRILIALFFISLPWLYLLSHIPANLCLGWMPPLFSDWMFVMTCNSIL